MADLEAIVDTVFTYQPVEPDQIEKYQAIRQGARDFARTLLTNTPKSADQTMAIRKLRECVMTANASIALKGIV